MDAGSHGVPLVVVCEKRIGGDRGGCGEVPFGMDLGFRLLPLTRLGSCRTRSVLKPDSSRTKISSDNPFCGRHGMEGMRRNVWM